MKRAYVFGIAVIAAVAVLVPAGLLWQSHANNDAPKGEINAYYLPRDEQCTVLVDFAAQRTYVDGLDGNRRQAYLAQQMIREFCRGGAAGAKGATNIQMIAVYIEGKDNYNRPDFSKRVTLLKVRGTAAQLQSFTDTEAGDWNRVAAAFKTENP
jgi:hypothetical protein